MTSVIERKLDAIEARARAQVESVAAQYRLRVLVPFCRRHRFTYIAGMGMTVFYDDEHRSIGSADDAILEERPELVPIFDVLDIHVLGSNVDVFGYYIAEITVSDW